MQCNVVSQTLAFTYRALHIHITSLLKKQSYHRHMTNKKERKKQNIKEPYNHPTATMMTECTCNIVCTTLPMHSIIIFTLEWLHCPCTYCFTRTCGSSNAASWEYSQCGYEGRDKWNDIHASVWLTDYMLFDVIENE